MRRSLLAIFVPAILLGASFVNPAFAETNRQAICSASRYCTVNGGNGCGPGATCTNSPALMTACGYEVSDPNGIHSSNEGRCLTATQQTCLTDSGGCLDRDAGAPPASGATTICCSCTNGAQQMCAQFTDISACGNARNSQSYQALISRTPNPVANFNCTGGNLVETRCRPTAQNGICQQGPAPLSSLFPLQPTPPASQPAPIDSTTGNAQRAPGILPQLGVPIPGLTFSAASFSNGRTNSNFIAQYIAAIFRLGTQLAFVAATIMVTYGGFRYLIGSAGGDIKRGKEIIKDAIIGMLIALSGYVILATVSPSTLSLEMSNLSSIEHVDLSLAVPHAADDPFNPVIPPHPTNNANQCAAFRDCGYELITIRSVLREIAQSNPDRAQLITSKIWKCEGTEYSDTSAGTPNCRSSLNRAFNSIAKEPIMNMLEHLPSGKIQFGEIFRSVTTQYAGWLSARAPCGPNLTGFGQPRNACPDRGHGNGTGFDIYWHPSDDAGSRNCGEVTAGMTYEQFLWSQGWVRFGLEDWHFERREDYPSISAFPNHCGHPR